MLLPVRNNFLHPPDNPALQPHLDAMGVSGGLCQNILYDPFGQFAGALVFFLDDLNPDAGFDG